MAFKLVSSSPPNFDLADPRISRKEFDEAVANPGRRATPEELDELVDVLKDALRKE